MNSGSNSVANASMQHLQRRLSSAIKTKGTALLIVPVVLFLVFVVVHYAHTPDPHDPTVRKVSSTGTPILRHKRAEDAKLNYEENADLEDHNDIVVEDPDPESHDSIAPAPSQRTPAPAPTPAQPAPAPPAPAPQPAPSQAKTQTLDHPGFPEDDEETRERRQAIRDAMKHAWDGYKKFAWGKDELKPVSKSFQDWLQMGCTIVDSMDTLWLMGLKDEFDEGRDWIAQHLDFNRDNGISVFETTIRSLGGLLSAYEFSRDEVFLKKARDLAEKLLAAFNTPSGIPYATLWMRSGRGQNPGWTGGNAILAELGTLQLEFKYLAFHLNEPIFAEKVDKVMDVLEDKADGNGLWPTYWSPNSGAPTSSFVTFGALGDSFYEYLIKQYIFTGKTETRYLDMYKKSLAGAKKLLIQKSNPSGFTYIGEWQNRVVHKMDHLACFVGGMFALGAAHTGFLDEDRELGAGIAETCYQMYHRQPTHVAPEFVNFRDGMDMISGANHNLLRPETVETLFYMYYYTNDKKYQDWGWEIFKGFEAECKTPVGWSGIRDVTHSGSSKDDLQQTFFMAETLKYLYLLFSPDKPINLEEYVFNTEAHPLGVFEKHPFK
eukprot:GFYU01003736.1.p1 GENE.GFYU01003736.1~~GFYU01003736.1.p1  ORF type:complete len:603 (+),score=177.51 GFYU01003736.1:130-1938(+)